MFGGLAPLAAVVLVLCALVVPRAAHAQGAADAPAKDASPAKEAASAKFATPEAPPPPSPPVPAWENAPPERRFGFMVGLTFGGGMGQASGFPNDPKKIQKQSYYTETGLGYAGAGTLWIGGALTDWLTFGVGMAASEIVGSSTIVRSYAFDFRVEAFPLYSLGGHFRDLGVILDSGAGTANGTPKGDPSTKVIDGGGVSRVGFGAFYEALRLKKIAIGPYLEGDYAWSDSARRGGVFLGLRTVLYSKP